MRIKTLINTILIITMLLILSIQSVVAEEIKEEKYPDISLIHDKTLSVDKIIGERLVKYYEHIIDDVKIKGDYILIHNNPTNGDLITFEKTWTDIDFQIPTFNDFEPTNYLRKGKIIIPDEEDLRDYYSFNNPVEFPIACWEIGYEDGRVILYNTNGEEIGKGIPSPYDGYVLSGPHYDGGDVWENNRINAQFWYNRWCDSYTSIFSPYPSQISSNINDPNVELFYELAHGDSYYFRAHTSGAHYYSANLANDMQNREKMRFAFIGSCESMTNTGPGTFSYEFRKGQMTNTTTVGFDHMQNCDGGMEVEIPWQNRMFSLMDQGLTIKESFDLATAYYPVIEPAVVFVGDGDMKIRELVNRNPIVPYYPSPSDNIENRDIEVDLSWSSGDHDYWNKGPMAGVYDTVTYDIYLDTNSNPSTKIGTIGPFLANQNDFSFDPGLLEYDAQYYWKIVARDNHDAETTGPIWNFKTTDYCEDQLDQYNTQFDTIGHTISNGNLKAQSFIPSKNVLSKISLFIKKRGIPTDNLEMIICDDSSGEPDINNEIISISLPPDYIDRNFSWIEFDFFDISVTAGETYYIILQSSSGNILTDCYEWGLFSQNVYPQGQYWVYWGCNPGWQTDSSSDFCFKTYGFQDNSENGLDQKQTDINGEIYLTEPSAGGLMGYDRVAQSFIPSLDKLSRIKLMIQKEGSPNEINVAIRSNLDGNNLTSISKSSEEINDEVEQVEFDFTDIDVIPGNTYYIVISSDGGDLYNHYKLAVGYNTDYINGIFYTFERNSWMPKTNTDLWFKTYSIDNGPETYTITASAGPGGNINPSGTITVNHGEDKTFTITPNTGYHITNVLVDGVSQGAISSYTFYNIVASHTITASFAINQYELTINIEGQGTTNPGEGTYEYDEGYSVRITATPSEGYLFSHWTGDVTGSDNPIIVIMNSDKTVTAQFTPENQEYILTINTVGEGTLTKDPDLATYTNGTNVTLTATPNDNNHIFHHWTGDTTGYNNPATITMNSDKTITAVFTLRGDVNCDGTVGAADITYVQQIILGDLTNIPAADVNQDGNFDILDITAIEIIFLS